MLPASAPLLLLLAAGPLDRVPQDGPGAVVRKAMAHHGGFDAWEGKSTVQFRKTTTRFGADGKPSRGPTQFHRYTLHPSMRARIEWEEDGHKVVLVNDGRQAMKLIDGKPALATADVNQARNVTFGSHYVFNMPFKLADPGAQLAPLPRRTLPRGVRADAVGVTYAPGAGDAAGLHTWTYFFDVAKGRLTANLLKYGPDQYEYTEYHDDIVVEGLRLARRRLGYGGDASGRKGPRTSEIVYEDVDFDVSLDPALFVLPAAR